MKYQLGRWRAFLTSLKDRPLLTAKVTYKQSRLFTTLSSLSLQNEPQPHLLHSRPVSRIRL